MDESDDYIPKSDEEFAVWLDNFIAVARELLDELPITAEDLANLEAKRNEWKISCAAHLEAEANAKEADRELTEAGRKLKVAQRESMDGGTLPSRNRLASTASYIAAEGRTSVNRFGLQGAKSQCRKLGNQVGRNCQRDTLKSPTFRSV